MTADPTATAPTFQIRYQSGELYNRDLSGSGTMAVQTDGFMFRGRTRQPLFRGPARELLVHPAEIRNAMRAGNRIQFTTLIGESGAAQKPFMFWCATDDEAEAVLRTLPAEKDEAFHQTASFQIHLQQVSPDISGWRSVTNVLIAANVIAFVVMGLLGAGWFETASMKPYMLYAANNGAATTDGEWWRLLTSMFVHYGILHIALNMWALFQVGHLVERLLGRVQYTLMYFASGIAGGFTTLLWHGDKVWSAGASGAIFGVYGALLGYLWREKHGIPKPVLQPLMKSTLVFAGYNLLFGAVTPQIDNTAHVGGLLAGVLFGWLAALPLDAEVRRRETPRRLVLGAVTLCAIIAIGVKASPRYAYSVRDELAWEDVVQPRVKAEQELEKQAEAKFSAYQQGRPGAGTELRQWLQATGIPFYDQWRAEVAALKLEPGRTTERRRNAFLHVVDLQIASYRNLSAAITRHDPNGWNHYVEAKRAILAAVQAIGK
ncbi:MAG TPA: rhomboid family intramembrane serine protease [Opitutaceae bacterium]|nr:rhomboid family intramembrane serine protease [Opitutaceae bacterium]